MTQRDPNLPVVRIRHFHCRGVGSIPGQGTIPMPGGVAKIQNRSYQYMGMGALGVRILNIHPTEPVDKKANLAGSNMSDY